MWGRRIELALLLVALAAAMVLMTAILPAEPMVDEHFHLGQIRFINSDEFVRVPELTTPLGYHYSVARPARWLGVDSLTGLRGISAVLGLLAVVLAWACVHRGHGDGALMRAFQVLLCPLLWPFYFLLYTDLVSLSVVLAGLLFVLSGQYLIAGLIGIAMLGWRQSNVFWAALLWLMALHQAGLGPALSHLLPGKQHGMLQNPGETALRALKATWPLALPLLAFIVFLVVNQGVAMGDRLAHQFGARIYPAQIFFLLLTAWLVLLPLHLARLADIVGLLRQRPLIIVGLIALFVGYMASFSVTHVYNLGLPEFHLRNRVLAWLDGDWLWRALAFIGMAWTLLTLAVTRLKTSSGYWLYPVTVAALLPVELIEQRYYIVPMVFFLLLRERGRPSVEWSLLIWFALLSAGLTAAIASQRYFL
jgi:alpha-1,2-glucosyltransferase